MALQRIDKMTEPPVVGRWYMVPSIRAMWCHEINSWPVVGHLHVDQEFFDFPWQHYHVDGRFLTKHQQEFAIGWRLETDDPDYRKLARACMGSPLQTNDRGCNPSGLPEPILMRKRCAVAALPLGAHVREATSWQKMAASFAGQECARGKRGFVCPHRGFALGSVAVVDGVIVCPLHGLRIDAETGTVLPP